MSKSNQAHMKKLVRQRTVQILVQLAKNTGRTLKQVGLYQLTPNRIIIDHYPTIHTAKAIKGAMAIAKEELL